MLNLYVKALNLLNSLKDESGQDMIEYALMLGVVAVGAVGSLKLIATDVTNAYTAIQTALNGAL
jgi:pilus assembly protein Flp/PilA